MLPSRAGKLSHLSSIKPSLLSLFARQLFCSLQSLRPSGISNVLQQSKLLQLKSNSDRLKLQAQGRLSGASRIQYFSHSMDSISFLKQHEAVSIDEELMGPLGFSIDQLMELAGLSVACAIHEVYRPSQFPRVLIICGPGNNGGDGLVVGRHLHHFGYHPIICYPKKTDKPIYNHLLTQLTSLGVSFEEPGDLPESMASKYDLIVDAIFGFSFKGTPRPPFDGIIQKMKGSTKPNLPPVVSIDVPSGWHVEDGDINDSGFSPQMLVSLTAPKECARKFSGPHHFLGGRFVPPSIADKYSLQLPEYPGSAMCVRIGQNGVQAEVDVASLRKNYNLRSLLEEDCSHDPIQQFKDWFDDAVSHGVEEANAMTLATSDSNGIPSARMVLLKGFDATGFVWYTNYESRKGRELLSSQPSHASLLFWWPDLQRQVRVEGKAEKVPEHESNDYFHSRPRGSQVGAHASPQSTVIRERSVLEEEFRRVEKLFPEGENVPRPKNWGGFRLTPSRVEFWQGRESRLHDRIVYERHEDKTGLQEASWKMFRLAP